MTKPQQGRPMPPEAAAIADEILAAHDFLDGFDIPANNAEGRPATLVQRLALFYETDAGSASAIFEPHHHAALVIRLQYDRDALEKQRAHLARQLDEIEEDLLNTKDHLQFTQAQLSAIERYLMATNFTGAGHDASK